MSDPKMTCPSTEESTALLDFVEHGPQGESGRLVESHLRQCPTCAQMIEGLRRVDALLRRHRDVFHPDEAELFDFVATGIDPDGIISLHLNECQDCREAAHLLQEMLRVGTDVPGPSPAIPASLLKRLAETHPRAGGASEWRGWREVVRTLRLRLGQPWQFPTLAVGTAMAVLIVIIVGPRLWTSFVETRRPTVRMSSSTSPASPAPQGRADEMAPGSSAPRIPEPVSREGVARRDDIQPPGRHYEAEKSGNRRRAYRGGTTWQPGPGSVGAGRAAPEAPPESAQPLEKAKAQSGPGRGPGNSPAAVRLDDLEGGNTVKSAWKKPTSVPEPAKLRRVRTVAPYLAGVNFPNKKLRYLEEPQNAPSVISAAQSKPLTGAPVAPIVRDEKDARGPSSNAEEAPGYKAHAPAKWGAVKSASKKPTSVTGTAQQHGEERELRWGAAPRQAQSSAPSVMSVAPSKPLTGAPVAPTVRDEKDARGPSSNAEEAPGYKAHAPARRGELTDRQGPVSVEVEIVDENDKPVQWLAYVPDPDLALNYSFVDSAKGSRARAVDEVHPPMTVLPATIPAEEHPASYRIVVRVIAAEQTVNLEGRLVDSRSGTEKKVLTQSQVPKEKAEETVRQMVRSLLDLK